MELTDTSVWARKSSRQIAGWFTDALVLGDLVTCDLVALEILAGATSRELYYQTREDLRGVRTLQVGVDDWQRALEVYDLLEAQLGTKRRRSVKIPDLLIAACAERHGTPVVHYDADFDTIARVTGQATRWAAPRDSLG